MRNWNCIIRDSTTRRASRFHLTYEELKRGFPVLFFSQSVVFILPMRNWNEVFVCIFCIFSWVFILPMRNWNLEAWKEEEAKEWRVFILPMRNWNKKIYWQKLSVLVFSSYLWGIETIFLGAFSLCIFRSFHLTYEELKLAPWTYVASTFDGFHLTYEELKLDYI